jgi:hypothetical protein
VKLVKEHINETIYPVPYTPLQIGDRVTFKYDGVRMKGTIEKCPKLIHKIFIIKGDDGETYDLYKNDLIRINESYNPQSINNLYTIKINFTGFKNEFIKISKYCHNYNVYTKLINYKEEVMTVGRLKGEVLIDATLLFTAPKKILFYITNKFSVVTKKGYSKVNINNYFIHNLVKTKPEYLNKFEIDNIINDYR